MIGIERHSGEFDIAPGARISRVKRQPERCDICEFLSFNLPILPEGTYKIRARVSDIAGNVGTSNIITMQVDPYAGILGSQALRDLAMGGSTSGGSTGGLGGLGEPSRLRRLGYRSYRGGAAPPARGGPAGP